MIIRYAEESDAKAIVEVSLKTWRTTYTGIMKENIFEEREKNEDSKIKNIEQRIKNKEAKILVCEINGKIVAFVDYGVYSDEDIKLESLAEVNAIYILKDYQRMGIGKKMIKQVVENCIRENFKVLAIWGLKDNQCTNFYKKIGGKANYSRMIDIMGDSLEEIADIYDDLESLRMSI